MKAFIRTPVFWIPCSVVFLDWITKLYFNSTMHNPEIFIRTNLVTQCLISIVSIFKVLPKLLQGENINVKIYPYLGYVYGNIFDKIVATILIFLMILSLWILYKRFRPSYLWKYIYYVVAGAVLANTIELIIFGMVIDWLEIDLTFYIKTQNSLHSYGFPTVINLADAILHIFIPLTMLFYFGSIFIKRRVKNVKTPTEN
jgi:lipoprotein signal peptidase